jgi:3-keto-5-aminohexanoate cleavage enzyme
LLEEMQARGIRPELEVFEVGMVNTLHALQDRGLIPQAPYVNILLGSLGSAPAFAADLGHIVERLPADAEWAAAGIGIYQRPITMMAAAMGGNVRTGMEDNPKPADAGVSWGNVDAVRVARAAAELAGRRLATPSETRKRLGLPERTLSEVGAPGRVETAIP